MSKKTKPNDVLEEQLDRAFEILPNGDNIKKGFVEQLEKNLDVSEEPEDVLVGVGDIYSLDLDMIYTLNYISSVERALEEHKESCEICQRDEECEEFEIIDDGHGEGTSVFSDGQFVKADDGLYDIQNDTFTVQVNFGSSTFQVLKSPVIVERGLASICYPNQADLDSKGDYKCYGLPEEYKM